jgi:hypothetical protein
VVVLALPTLLVLIDVFVMLLALPHPSAALGASGIQQLWLNVLYSASNELEPIGRACFPGVLSMVGTRSTDRASTSPSVRVMVTHTGVPAVFSLCWRPSGGPTGLPAAWRRRQRRGRRPRVVAR